MPGLEHSGGTGAQFGSLGGPTTIFRRSTDSICLLLILGLAVVVGAFDADDAWQAVRPLSWDRVPCQILINEVARNESGHVHLALKFSYIVDGQEFESATYQLQKRGINGVAHARELVEEISRIENPHCYVNPADPREATFRAGSFIALTLPLASLVFVVVAIWQLRNVWRRSALHSPDRVPALTIDGDSRGQRWAFFGMGFLCSMIGCGYFLSEFGRPLRQVIKARNWIATPCRIVSSEIVFHGQRAEIEVDYAYEFAGRSYRSLRYEFLTGPAADRDVLDQIVRKLPPGTETTCFVDPDDPREAVLVRGFTSKMGWIFLPLMFIGGGGAFMWLAFRMKLGRQGSGVPDSWDLPDRPVDLAPTAGLGAQLLTLFLATVFVNGILSLFVVKTVQDWLAGQGNWLMTIIVTPALGFGLWLAYKVVLLVLRLLGPNPRLRLSRAQLRPGESFKLHWCLDRDRGRVRTIRIFLEGEEIATPDSSPVMEDDRPPEKHVFATIPVVDRRDDLRRPAGEQEFTIPPHTMHSFAGAYNQIQWRLKVIAEINWWPNVEEAFPVDLLPQRSEPR